jgi:ATP-binding protein involved in chromosome partitioning
MSDHDARAKLLASKGVTATARRGSFARNVLIVTSGKGGVGKSTISVNLASAFAQLDWRVGLLDADVYGPSIPRMLQLEDARLEWNDENRIVCAENFGIKVMSVGMTTPTLDTPLIWRSSVATSALVQLLDDVEWGTLDLLVIDMPPGTGDTQLTMTQELSVTAALVVTTPQVIAIDDVRRAIRMLQEVKVPIAGIVENMSPFVAPDTGKTYALFGEGGGRALAEQYHLPLLAELPFDLDVRTSTDAGTPVMISGTAPQKARYLALARRLVTQGTLTAP